MNDRPHKMWSMKYCARDSLLNDTPWSASLFEIDTDQNIS